MNYSLVTNMQCRLISVKLSKYPQSITFQLTFSNKPEKAGNHYFRETFYFFRLNCSRQRNYFVTLTMLMLNLNLSHSKTETGKRNKAQSPYNEQLRNGEAYGRYVISTKCRRSIDQIFWLKFLFYGLDPFKPSPFLCNPKRASNS